MNCYLFKVKWVLATSTVTTFSNRHRRYWEGGEITSRYAISFPGWCVLCFKIVLCHVVFVVYAKTTKHFFLLVDHHRRVRAWDTNIPTAANAAAEQEKVEGVHGTHGRACIYSLSCGQNNSMIWVMYILLTARIRRIQRTCIYFCCKNINII